MGCVAASSIMSHSSEQNFAAASSPKNPARSIWALRGSAVAAAALSSEEDSGKNRLTAVLCTISSSKPKQSAICFSIHCTRTARFSFVKSSTVLWKLAGNLVVLSALLSARESSTEEVPLIAGIDLNELPRHYLQTSDRSTKQWVYMYCNPCCRGVPLISLNFVWVRKMKRSRTRHSIEGSLAFFPFLTENHDQ